MQILMTSLILSSWRYVTLTYQLSLCF